MEEKMEETPVVAASAISKPTPGAKRSRSRKAIGGSKLAKTTTPDANSPKPAVRAKADPNQFIYTGQNTATPGLLKEIFTHINKPGPSVNSEVINHCLQIVNKLLKIPVRSLKSSALDIIADVSNVIEKREESYQENRKDGVKTPKRPKKDAMGGSGDGPNTPRVEESNEESFNTTRPMNGTTPADGDKTQPMQSAQAAKKGSPKSSVDKTNLSKAPATPKTVTKAAESSSGSSSVSSSDDDAQKTPEANAPMNPSKKAETAAKTKPVESSSEESSSESEDRNKSTANGKTPSWPSKLPGSPSKTPATKTTSVKPVDSSSGESSSDSADTKEKTLSNQKTPSSPSKVPTSPSKKLSAKPTPFKPAESSSEESSSKSEDNKKSASNLKGPSSPSKSPLKKPATTLMSVKRQESSSEESSSDSEDEKKPFPKTKVVASADATAAKSTLGPASKKIVTNPMDSSSEESEEEEVVAKKPNEKRAPLAKKTPAEKDTSSEESSSDSETEAAPKQKVAPKKPSHVKKAVAKKAKKPDSSDESSSSNGEDNSKKLVTSAKKAMSPTKKLDPTKQVLFPEGANSSSEESEPEAKITKLLTPASVPAKPTPTRKKPLSSESSDDSDEPGPSVSQLKPPTSDSSDSSSSGEQDTLPINKQFTPSKPIPPRKPMKPDSESSSEDEAPAKPTSAAPNKKPASPKVKPTPGKPAAADSDPDAHKAALITPCKPFSLTWELEGKHQYSSDEGADQSKSESRVEVKPTGTPAPAQPAASSTQVKPSGKKKRTASPTKKAAPKKVKKEPVRAKKRLAAGLVAQALANNEDKKPAKKVKKSPIVSEGQTPTKKTPKREPKAKKPRVVHLRETPDNENEDESQRAAQAMLAQPTNSRDKSGICTICNKMASRLTEHMKRIHLNPFGCPHGTSCRRFATYEKAEDHIKRSHAEKGHLWKPVKLTVPDV